MGSKLVSGRCTAPSSYDKRWFGFKLSEFGAGNDGASGHRRSEDAALAQGRDRI